MADDEEVVVNIDEEKTPGGDALGHDEAVAELKRQYDALEADNKKEREAKEAANHRAALAEQTANQARKDAAEARTAVSDSQAASIDSGLAAAQAEAASAEADYAALMEKGDFAGAAKAQRRIAAAEARIVRLDEAKADLETRKSSSAGQDQTQVRSGDPFEDHLHRPDGRPKFTAPTEAWMRAHRDWVIDPRKSSKLESAHHLAVINDLVPDTDEYFEHVEKTLGMRQAQANGSDGEQQTRTVRRSSPQVAPVNGGGGAHSSGAGERRGNEVRLTAAEAKAANDGQTLVWNPGQRHPKTGQPIQRDDPLVGKAIGNQEMARRKLELQRTNAYDKSYTEGQ